MFYALDSPTILYSNGLVLSVLLHVFCLISLIDFMLECVYPYLCFIIAKYNLYFQKQNLTPHMFKALVENKEDFVRLFLDNGVEMRRFLTGRNLRDLYKEV